MDDTSDQKQHIIESLKQANNILVTVRSSPSIDQLAACIALTLVLNELGKHGTAVFSGHVPSVLEFLEPGKTIERNTDSLQDFIISLDKSKADKLRYKVEDTVVKIFITPYRTSITDKDLEFGQGDFNVDVVVALGVHNQDDLDQAITAHGRILHDATVISVNTEPGGSEDLGSINWIDTNASSLSEMIAGIANSLGKEGEEGKEGLIDNQIATALLTGIVAETERFGNAKTTPQTMEMAAKLLTAGANQELVASKLSEPAKTQMAEPEATEDHDDDKHDGGGEGGSKAPDLIEPIKPNDGGMLEIDHPGSQHDDAGAAASLTEPGKPSDGNETDLAHMSTPFAHEGDDFEIPQPEDALQMMSALPEAITNAQASSGDTSAGAGQVPPIYTPGQSAPSDQNSQNVQPSFNLPLPGQYAAAPVLNGQPAVAQAQTEEVAALGLLKERKVQLDNRAVIQPLRGQGEFLSDPPKNNQVMPGKANEDQLAARGELENTKYALTPPTMGGTLTANSTNDHEDPSGSAMSAAKKSDTPLLSHDTPRTAAVSAAPAAPQITTHFAPAPATPPSVAAHLESLLEPLKPGESTAAPVDLSDTKAIATPAVPHEPLIAPAFDMHIEVPAAQPAAPTPPVTPALPAIEAAPAKPATLSVPEPASPTVVTPPPIDTHQTLADLERSVHSPHLALSVPSTVPTVAAATPPPPGPPPITAAAV